MSQTVTKTGLTGSPGNNRRIKIAATASPGTIVHQVGAGETADIFLDVYNSTVTSDVDVTVEFGGTTAPDDAITKAVSAKGKGVIPLHRGTLIGPATVRVYAAVANVITIGGDVNVGV